jgi:prephenate dehydrogenase
VVLWEIAETRSERVRALARERAAARALLADVDARIARVDRAETEFATGVEADFGQLADRSSELARDVAMQLADREAAIAEAFRRTVDEEQAHVEQHLLSARIAIARATDQLAAGPPAREPGT